MILLSLVAATGLLSALLYVRQRQFIKTLLVLLATSGIFFFIGDFSMPASIAARSTTATTMRISDQDVVRHPTLLPSQVQKIVVDGDGLRSAQWQDLPRVPMEWKKSEKLAIALSFPRQLPLGRLFTLEACC